MRVLMIDAGPNPESTTYIALNEIRGQLQKEGVECEIVHTGGQNVEGCRFCNSCKKTGRCVLDDCLNPLLERRQRRMPTSLQVKAIMALRTEILRC